MKKNEQRKFNDLIEEHQVNKEIEHEVVEEVLMSNIKPNPDQPRKHFDDDSIEHLALSIKQNGLFQPIILKKGQEGYLIIAGERRYRACKQLNMKTIPAIIRQYQNRKIQEIALIENIQRENLNAMEEARSFQRIIEDNGYKAHELALKVGKSRSHVINMIGLLKLPLEVQRMVEKNMFSMGHARAISKLRSEKDMIKLAHKVIEKKLSVRQVEAYIHENIKKTPKQKVSYRMTDVETQINATYNVKSNVQSGSITIKGKDSDIQKIIQKLTKR